MSNVEIERGLTANQLFKIYKNEGGTLDFKAWLTREKKKGTFSADGSLSNEINNVLNDLRKKDVNKTVLGFPVQTLVIVGAVIVGALVVHQIVKTRA